jgi:hypothetical protein
LTLTLLTLPGKLPRLRSAATAIGGDWPARRSTGPFRDSILTLLDFSPTVPLPGIGPVPLNVALICERTWMCAPSHEALAGRPAAAREMIMEMDLPRERSGHAAS